MKFPPSNYDPEHIKILTAALELACEELGISADDVASRERVAKAILDLARAGQKDAERLKTYAIDQYRRKK